VGPIHIVIKYGEDVLPVIEPSERLAFSDYLIKLFLKGGITGWEALPERVKVTWAGKGAKPKIPVYHEIRVMGRAGHISQYPEVVMQTGCPACGHRTWSVPKNVFQVKEDLWDGSNLFWIGQFPGYLADEKFVEFVRVKRVRGFKFIPTEEWYYQYD
jgi:hypothetical protein